MQRPVDSVTCNKDTLLCLRSSCVCGVSLSSGLPELTGGGGASGKCRSVVQGGPEHSWSTKGGCGPFGPPGPLRSILIHTF